MDVQDLLHKACPGACSHWLKLTLNSGFRYLVTTVLVTLTSYLTQLASSQAILATTGSFYKSTEFSGFQGSRSKSTKDSIIGGA